jgi:hypothetical protein
MKLGSPAGTRETEEGGSSDSGCFSFGTGFDRCRIFLMCSGKNVLSSAARFPACYIIYAQDNSLSAEREKSL